MTIIANLPNMLDKIRDGLFMTDQRGMITFVNEPLAEMHGLDGPEEMIGKHFSEFVSPEFRTEIANKFKRAVEEESFSEIIEFCGVRKEGASIFLQLKHGPIVEKGEIVGTVGVIRDVTPQKRAEEALAASEKKYRAIIENMSDVVYIVDQSGRLTFITPSIRLLIGYEQSEVIGHNIREFMDKEEFNRALHNIAHALSENRTISNEYRLLHKNGGIRWVQTFARPLYEGDEVVGLQGSLWDITERKQAEEAIRNLNENLEQQVAERTKLAEDRARKLQTLVRELTLAEQRERQRLAKTLHDHLQQLLVGARINSEILSASVGGEQKQIVETVLNLINNSIQTSRSLTAELSPPVLKQGLSAALEWICHRMQETHALTVELKTDPRIDPKREDVTVFLYQSARELLFNVIKHAGVKSARLEMSHDERNRLCVTITDRGSGFDPVSIWGMEQMGFGLFSIRERLALMGGSLQIKSSPGNGASLSLTTPLETTKEQEKKRFRTIRSRIQKAKTPGDRIRVLLADDHEVVRQGLCTLLGLHSDIEVVGEAADGDEAVEKARQLQPDVILMDISMPKMDGLQATRIIHAEFPDIRIIGLSMYDGDEQAASMIAAGGSAYCTKGDPTDVLLSAIRGGGYKGM